MHIVALVKPYGAFRAFVHGAALAALLFVYALPAFAEERLILTYGDSLMAGYGLKPGEGFAPQLERALRAQGHDVRVRNASVSGDTSAAGRARLEWVLGALTAKPDLVILGLGANDMLRGLDPKLTHSNLTAMLGEFRQRQIRVLIAGMLAAPNLGSAYRREFDAIYPRLAVDHKLALYPFFTDGVTAHRDLLLGDGMHPNAAGIRVIVNKVLPVIVNELD